MPDPARHVDMWWGTGPGGTGHNPGPQVPWGAIFPGPATFNPDTDFSGYHPDFPTRGFTQERLVGFYGPTAYGYPLITPSVGVQTAVEDRASERAEEHAEVGYYRMKRAKDGITTEITSDHYTAIYRFTFRKSRRSTVCLDLSYTQDGDAREKYPGETKSGVDDAEIQLDRAHASMSGFMKNGRGGAPVYFHARFSKKPVGVGVWHGGDVMEGTPFLELQKGERGGGYVTFDTRDGEPVLMSIALSYRNPDAAAEFIREEIPDFDFEGTREKCRAAWNRALSRVTVEAPEAMAQERTFFYTTLYRDLQSPRDRTADCP